MPMVTIDLTADARAEAARVVAARALLRDAEGAAWRDDDGPCVVTARAHSLRERLGRRVLLIWSLTSDDGLGAESHIVATMVGGDSLAVPRDRAGARALVAAAAPHAADLVERSSAGWRRAARQAARAFTATRAARTDAIVRHLPAGDPLFQPGLFDRRAEQARQRQTSAAAEGHAACADRTTDVNQGFPRSLQPRLRLVLLP